ncbi:DUF1190 domain-containing protein [Mangrovicoccus sp. HB182678]|uniref:DUF1190 domain-containing protein n=2 Tax=Mangrovicoccus algicola TaxID=2771008 RepID=A0A8J6YWJ3_9RHOB|nr:DUF1190 domain-containing protein [Mangrovicoccus algicola]
MPPRRRKRSARVAVMVLGAGAFALAGCREEQVEAQAFPDLAACEAAAGSDPALTIEACRTSFEEAQALNVESAPRYDSLEVCEELHGDGACGSEAQATQGGSGSIWMPLLAGYLIGNMMGGRSGYAGAQPLYRTNDGKFTNAAGSSTFSSNRGAARMDASQFVRPSPTVNKPPMSRASALSRGGFGATGSSRAAFGG